MEYDAYSNSTVLEAASKEVFGDEYVGQQSSLTPSQVTATLARQDIRCDGTIVDAGCGRGGLSCAISAVLGSELIGIDSSVNAITAARSYAAENGFAGRCSFEVGDIVTLDQYVPPATADLIVSLGSVYWITGDRGRTAAASWERVLDDHPGAAILIIRTTIIGSPRPEESPFLPLGLYEAHQTWIDQLADSEFTKTVRTTGAEFAEWAESWCAAIERREEELEREMGKANGEWFVNRFRLLRELAAKGLVERQEVCLRRRDPASKSSAENASQS